MRPILLLLACCAFMAAAESVTGKTVLKDATNGDAKVGSAVQEGIPQGHALKIALEGGRQGRRMASGAELTVVLRQNGQELQRLGLTLDQTGYGEVLMPIAQDYQGLYQVKLVQAGPGGKAQETGLGATFRVVEGEPFAHVPEGLPALILVLGAGVLALAGLRLRPVSA